MHSTDKKIVHIDIYQFAPTKKRPYWTLVTGGMSDMRQIEPVDPSENTSLRCEILMYVTEPQQWMFSVLKDLAEMPFEESTYLHWWHTVPNGKPMTTRPSLLTSFFFLPPYFEQNGFDSLMLEGDPVDFLWMIPITEKEREYAINNGSLQLEKKIEEFNLSPVVDEARKSII
jgi:hypothetical protein